MGQRDRRRKASLGWSASFAALAVLAVALNAGPAAALISVSGSDGPGGTVSVGASSGGSSPGSSGSSSSSGSSGPGAGTGRSGPSRNGGGGGGGASGASPWSCTSTSLLLNDEGGFAPGGPTPGGWYSVTCINRVTGASTTQTEWITSQAAAAPSTPAATATPTIDPRVVALQAERSLRLPAPVLHFNPAAESVVYLPTWLWIDPSIWHPLSVTASAGPVSATAVATPESVTWQMGDGGAVVCAGPGRPFDLALPADHQVASCQYTFRTSSLGQPSPDGDPDSAAYSVRATVTWAVSWTAQGAPGQGVLPSLSTAGTASVRVVQVESINSGRFGLSARSDSAGSGEESS